MEINVLSERITDLADSISSGLFADRDSLGDAWTYVEKVAKSFGKDSIMVWTAVYVMTNTIAKQLRNIEKEKEEYETEGHQGS